MGEDAVLYRRHGDVGLSKLFAQSELLAVLANVLGEEKKKD